LWHTNGGRSEPDGIVAVLHVVAVCRACVKQRLSGSLFRDLGRGCQGRTRENVRGPGKRLNSSQLNTYTNEGLPVRRDSECLKVIGSLLAAACITSYDISASDRAGD
jgi:hypothetical protein